MCWRTITTRKSAEVLSVAGQPGVAEVQVDAGNGKVISVKHESLLQEAQEKSGEHGRGDREILG